MRMPAAGALVGSGPGAPVTQAALIPAPEEAKGAQVLDQRFVSGEGEEYVMTDAGTEPAPTSMHEAEQAQPPHRHLQHARQTSMQWVQERMRLPWVSLLLASTLAIASLCLLPLARGPHGLTAGEQLAELQSQMQSMQLAQAQWQAEGQEALRRLQSNIDLQLEACDWKLSAQVWKSEKVRKLHRHHITHIQGFFMQVEMLSNSLANLSSEVEVAKQAAVGQLEDTSSADARHLGDNSSSGADEDMAAATLPACGLPALEAEHGLMLQAEVVAHSPMVNDASPLLKFYKLMARAASSRRPALPIVSPQASRAYNAFI